jgi:hypothetical protein
VLYAIIPEAAGKLEQTGDRKLNGENPLSTVSPRSMIRGWDRGSGSLTWTLTASLSIARTANSLDLP